MGRSKQISYLFEDKGAATVTARGGKGFGLNEQTLLGIRTPSGFTITTAVARAFAQHGCVPMRLDGQVRRDLQRIEKKVGKTFGSPENALLVSVRSGAAVSMPGMMDTVLNLGINKEITRGIAEQHGARFAYDCYRRFLSTFGNVVMGVERAKFAETLDNQKRLNRVELDSMLSVDALRALCWRYGKIIETETGSTVPEDPSEQLALAIQAVLRSWNNPRAVAYRQEMGIKNGLGTAVNVQSMVYGNLDDNSGTGVVFSRNVATGDSHLFGEFLVNAQGEDIVDGSRTPLPIESMREWDGAVYEELCDITRMLEVHRNDVVDIEFTVESGRLYILQVRNAKRTPEAAATIATHFVWEKRWTKEEALANVSANQLKALTEASFSDQVIAEARAKKLVLSTGVSASPGAAIGRVVFTSDQAVAAAKLGEKVILVRPDTSPDDLNGMLSAAAVVTYTGGSTSHAAVVARSLGKPAIVGCNELSVAEGELISVDGRSGLVFKGELERKGGLDKKEVNLLRRWAVAASCSAKPELNFEHMSTAYSVSLLVNDFYLADAMAKASEGTILHKQAEQLRKRIHQQTAERIVTYLAVAVASEVPYAYGSHMRKRLYNQCAADMDALKNEFRAERGIADPLRGMSHSMHIRYLQLAAKVFEAPAWATYAHFGGKKWAAIARAAETFLSGQVNATVFADHAFDLEHNGGSVFGKSPMLTRSSVLRMQLNEKKRAVSVSSLFHMLYSLFPEVSDEVESLYRTGVEMKLWQDFSLASRQQHHWH